MSRGHPALPTGVAGPLCLLPSAALHAIDWEAQAAGLTCTLDATLFLAATRNRLPGLSSALVWVPQAAQPPSLPGDVRPVLLLQAAAAASQTTQVELVLHLDACDPLLHHIALVLQRVGMADSGVGRLYAEALTEALGLHLLRRYAACPHTPQACPRELAPAKLRRIVTYIRAHLEEPLSIPMLAAVVQAHPAYFARLFKQATGQTPHQYVLGCRIERAKQLLMETTTPLSEIGLQVGCTDQSYFTALFRRHVGTTPKAYRDATAN